MTSIRVRAAVVDPLCIGTITQWSRTEQAMRVAESQHSSTVETRVSEEAARIYCPCLGLLEQGVERLQCPALLPVPLAESLQRLSEPYLKSTGLFAVAVSHKMPGIFVFLLMDPRAS